jgi:methyltransferase-like protein
VTNLYHQGTRLAPFGALVLRQLDGTRDPAAILDKLMGAVQSGHFTPERQSEPVRQLDETRALMGEALEPVLRRLARRALLVH